MSEYEEEILELDFCEYEDELEDAEEM